MCCFRFQANLSLRKSIHFAILHNVAQIGIHSSDGIDDLFFQRFDEAAKACLGIHEPNWIPSSAKSANPPAQESFGVAGRPSMHQDRDVIAIALDRAPSACGSFNDKINPVNRIPAWGGYPQPQR